MTSLNKFFIFLLISILSLSVYKIAKKNYIPTKLSEIAYDTNKDYGYTVYIEENSKLVPYLVLTKNYNGNVLLLRKYLLEELRIFNPNFRRSGYYENSSIDKFLNKEFIKVFRSSIQEKIVNSEIEIISKSSLGRYGKDTSKINRKLFLLSQTEVCLTKKFAEGRPLNYFKNYTSRIAYLETGEVSSWWMRSSYTVYDTAAWAVGYDATIGGTGVYNENGVRPSFCLDSTATIIEREDVLSGQVVFVLE